MIGWRLIEDYWLINWSIYQPIDNSLIITKHWLINSRFFYGTPSIPLFCTAKARAYWCIAGLGIWHNGIWTWTLDRTSISPCFLPTILCGKPNPKPIDGCNGSHVHGDFGDGLRAYRITSSETAPWVDKEVASPISHIKWLSALMDHVPIYHTWTTIKMVI